MVFTTSSLLIRFLSGKMSDRIGRVSIIKLSLFILVIAMIMIARSDSALYLLLSSAVYGIATGMLSPAITAWIVDLSHPDYRGKAIATMYIALEAGIGLGAFVAGALFISDVKMIPLTFYVIGLLTLLAFLYLQFLYKPSKFKEELK